MNLLNKIIFLKNKKHLNNLYSKALESKEEFKNFLIQHRPSNANLIMRNSLKSIHRVCEKIRGGNSPHNIFDVNGATYIFTSIEDLLKSKVTGMREIANSLKGIVAFPKRIRIANE